MGEFRRIQPESGMLAYVPSLNIFNPGCCNAVARGTCGYHTVGFSDLYMVS